MSDYQELSIEQRELLHTHLVRYFSIHEIADFFLESQGKNSLDSMLEQYCTCDNCRVCGKQNTDCEACDIKIQPCNCIE